MSMESIPRPLRLPAGRGMSALDAVAVAAISTGVGVLVAVADPKEALCYLLAFPVWIVSRDLGVVTGAAVGALALLLVFGASGAVEFGLLGNLALAAVYFGAAAAGAQAQPRAGGEVKHRSPLVRVLTTRPRITRRAEALSRRELEILEAIATGATNAEIAARFVISQNTVKTHVSHILRKLPAANRTEAASHYIDLYGQPSPPAQDAGANDAPVHESSSIGAASAVNATVSDVGRKNGRLALQLDDGRELELPLVDEIRGRADVGAAAIVYFDQHDRAVGWYLPEGHFGVDIRHWEP
jgi:DNA-binding NarL/FixJ family response regulator